MPAAGFFGNIYEPWDSAAVGGWLSSNELCWESRAARGRLRGRAGWLDICHDEMIRERKKPVGLGGGRRIEKDEMGEIELS